MSQNSQTRTPWALTHPLLTQYYDEEWGMPVTDEQGLFERLCLESFQSGLSWLTILKRRDAFREAFCDFDPETVAQFDESRVGQLLTNTRIIRNERKIRAAVHNAQCTLLLRARGGLSYTVWSHLPETSPTEEDAAQLPTQSPESQQLAQTLKQHGFTMVGPTTMYALMAATGVVDLHVRDSVRRGCSGVWNSDGTRTRYAEELLSRLSRRV